jgi:hypothetical protein
MPIQSVEFAWMWAESTGGATEVATETVNFPPQSVFAQASITTIDTIHTPGTPSGSTTINAQIKSYTKQNGTVVDLSNDPKNNVFFDTDVVSVTFQLKVISMDTNAVWASGAAYLFG